jgi:hypothetical protein
VRTRCCSRERLLIPTATSDVSIRNVRFTSTPAGRNTQEAVIAGGESNGSNASLSAHSYSVPDTERLRQKRGIQDIRLR